MDIDLTWAIEHLHEIHARTGFRLPQTQVMKKSGAEFEATAGQQDRFDKIEL